MRLFDKFRSDSRDKKDFEELRALRQRIVSEQWKRERVVSRLSLPEFAGELLDFEGIFTEFRLPETLTIADVVELTQLLKHTLQLQENEEALVASLQEILSPLTGIPEESGDGEDYGMRVSLLDRLHDPIGSIERIVRRALASEFWHLRETIQGNIYSVS